MHKTPFSFRKKKKKKSISPTSKMLFFQKHRMTDYSKFEVGTQLGLYRIIPYFCEIML